MSCCLSSFSFPGSILAVKALREEVPGSLPLFSVDLSLRMALLAASGDLAL